MGKKKPAITIDTKSEQQATQDCDWIALKGWDWWKGVVADAEQRARQTAREDA